MPYFDFLNGAMQDLQSDLADLTGLPVSIDPDKINPPCVFIDAPTFTAPNWNVAQVQFVVHVIGSGVGDIYTLQQLLETVSTVVNSKIGVIDGRPGTWDSGGTIQPCYDLNISVKAMNK